jgi:hypothetical protein
MAITRITSIRELKQLWIETLLNKTTKVTKVSDQSVLNGIAYGTAKIGQKALKDIALIESHLFPDEAFGAHLDIIAQRSGVGPRFGQSASMTYIKIIADPGTVYVAATNLFVGGGVSFELTENTTVGDLGFIYAKVRSQSIGGRTNVAPLVIATVSPAPSGHVGVLNEYKATGGRDIESDENFRIRIKNAANIAARGTLEYITQVMLNYNEDILRTYSSGVNDQHQQILSIATQNGIDLTVNELSQLLSDITPFLGLGEYNGITNTSVNVVLQNVESQYIDVDFRLELVSSADVDQVRIDIQTGFSKYLDPRFWKQGDRVEWDDLLRIVKQTAQVKNVSDPHFQPRADLEVDPSKLPRVRGFVMRSLDGAVMIDTNQVISPIFYPAAPDPAFITTITN